MMYIALLRGINVSGHKTIKMNELIVLCETLGFQHTQTYIQSGNLVFETTIEVADKIETILYQAIETQYGFEVPVIVYPFETYQAILTNNILQNEQPIDHLYITYLSNMPDFSLQSDIESKMTPTDQIHFTNRAVYLLVPNGYGKTKLTNALIEKKLKVNATTRNWKTSQKLLQIAEQLLHSTK